MTFTEADAEKFAWFQSYHGNKGYDRDEHGNSQEPHLGYVWGHACNECPRLVWELHIMSPSDKPDWETWRVDGEVVYKTIGEALAALEQPPVLSLFEFLAYMRLARHLPVDDGVALELLTGKPNPTPQFIDGIWSRASSVVSRLRAKGLIKWNEGMLEDASLS